MQLLSSTANEQLPEENETPLSATCSLLRELTESFDTVFMVWIIGGCVSSNTAQDSMVLLPGEKVRYVLDNVCSVDKYNYPPVMPYGGDLWITNYRYDLLQLYHN